MIFQFTKEGFLIDQTDEANQSEKERYRLLYHAGLNEPKNDADSTERYLHLVATTFFQQLMDMPELELARENIQITVSEANESALLQAVPFAIGSQYIDRGWLQRQFDNLLTIFAAEISAYDGTVAMYFTEKNQQLHVPERVFFHLVENNEADYPFAFLATYATQDEKKKVRHVPLKYALTEYENEREKLMTLLSCLNKAAELSPLIAGFMQSGELFHPLRLTDAEAYEFLKSAEEIEKTGILCRIPNWWRKRMSALSVSIQLGEKKASMLGFDTLVSVQPKLMADGVELTQKDIKNLLAQTEGLAFLKGKWIEVDHDRLKKLLDEMEQMPGEISLMDALRTELGTDKAKADIGALVSNGKWLSELLRSLRRPDTIRKRAVPKGFQATLRGYQQSGYTWLNYMDELGFGACLADDMGLGKTVQVLAYLEKLRKTKKAAKTLLIVPASLLGNWQKEVQKFAPQMDYTLLHGKSTAVLEQELAGHMAFLTITTYGMVSRIQALKDQEWDCLILDEAQAIKNPLTKQTRQVKEIHARMRIAMTGTPIENDLTNLWSLFDFLNKGLMGTSQEFRDFCKGLESHPQGYARLRTMISPFMLRRVKTDKTIIADLPEKIETVEYAAMSKKQVVLYRKVVSDMEKKMSDAESEISRKGIVLATIMKLKQICNHPDQYLGQEQYARSDSGKMEVLKEICETIYEKRERVIVFTQFKEITEYLAAFLKEIFQREGYVIHGGTAVAKRQKIVDAFQGEAYVPFIVLSVKAGGTGLNLTKANHVIHFDRWWNPAVENQATDRAFRIGQTKDVLVHKLVCRGTIEEKINDMIESKKELAQNVIGSGGEKWLTELSNEELMSMLKLQI